MLGTFLAYSLQHGHNLACQRSAACCVHLGKIGIVVSDQRCHCVKHRGGHDEAAPHLLHRRHVRRHLQPPARLCVLRNSPLFGLKTSSCLQLEMHYA